MLWREKCKTRGRKWFTSFSSLSSPPVFLLVVLRLVHSVRVLQDLIGNNRGKRDEARDDAIDRKIIGRSEMRRTTMRSM
jgi:hypothetical protein